MIAYYILGIFALAWIAATVYALIVGTRKDDKE